MALALAPPAAAEGRHIRTLTGDLATAGIDRLELKLPVGGIRIEPSADEKVHVDFDVRCKWNKEGCNEIAEKLALHSERDGRSLRIEVEGIPTLRGVGLQVEGVVQVPEKKALDVHLPVGELKIRGVKGDLDVDVGCGEVSIALREHDIQSVRIGVGVGEASLSVSGRHIEGSGWLGQKVRWGEGTGPARVAVTLGVGELGVRLD